MRYDGYKTRLTGSALREHHEKEKRRMQELFNQRRMRATLKSMLAAPSTAPVTLPRVKFLEGDFDG